MKNVDKVATMILRKSSYDVNVVGGFCVARDVDSLPEAKRIAKEKSRNEHSIVQVVKMSDGLNKAVAEYDNGKPYSNKKYM